MAGAKAPAARRPGSPPSVSAATQESRRGIMWAAIAGVVVVVVIVAAALFLNLNNHDTSAQTLAPDGTSYTIPAAHYEYIKFNVGASEWVTGSLTASNYMTLYLLDQSDYTSFASHGRVSTYQWSSGLIIQGSIDVNVGAGTYYLVILSQTPTEPITVQVTQALMVSP